MGYANTQKTDLSRYDCGTQALAYLLEQAGKRGMADTLRAVEPLSEKGFTVSDLLRMAEPLKLSANIISLQDLHDVKLPAILHFQGNTGHFAVLTEAGDDLYTILEPKTGGIRQLSKEDLSKSWTGVVLFQDSVSNSLGVALTSLQQCSIYGGDNEEAPPQPSGNGAPGPPPDCPPGTTGCCPFPPGAPLWTVNPVNMNLYVVDTPLFYSPVIGPDVIMRIEFNLRLRPVSLQIG